MRKLLLGLAAVLLLAAAFMSGWYVKGNKVSGERTASITPATQMVNSITTGESIDESYNNASELYRSTTKLDELKQAAATLKDAQVVSTQEYAGITDSFVRYDLVKADANYTLSVSTIKNDGKWQVNSVIANQITAQ